MVLNTILYTILCTVHGQVICIIACHAPITDNPENNQHFNVGLLI